MATAAVPRLTPAEFLAWERQQTEKHEFLNGEVVAMVGGTLRHALIGTHLIAALTNLLRDRPCDVFGSDLRVLVRATGLCAYPDVSVVCGTPELADREHDTLLNPVLLGEVLSPSTEAYDRGRKFAHYRQIPSLQHYLLVAQDEPRLEVFTRTASGDWTFAEAVGLDAVAPLPAIACALPLRDVYSKVFDRPQP